MNTILETINIKLSRDFLVLSPAKKEHKYCLIFLHGFDMSVQKFFSVFLSSSIIKLLEEFKIYIPQAPKRVIRSLSGKPAHSWYNLDDAVQFQEYAEIVEGIIEQEVKLVGNNYKNIFLGGFSQGTSLALNAGLKYGTQVGGIFVIGGFLSEYTKTDENQEYPNILVIHGDNDKILPWEKAEKTYKRILNRNSTKVHIIKGMEHDLYSEEAKSIVYEFIQERIKSN